MQISIIVAMGTHRQIGYRNKMPWHLSEDLKNFKRITMGHHILMGRRTFESIGRALPGRTNMVVSRNPDYVPAGGYAFLDVESAFQYAEVRGEKELFIIGGGDLFAQLLPKIQRIYCSRIPYVGPGDVTFPIFEGKGWNCIDRKDFIATDRIGPWHTEVWERRKANPVG